MTISTPRTEPLPTRPDGSAAPSRRPRRGVGIGGRNRAGFTLTEVIIAATLSTFMLAGILSAFVMIGRTGFLASSYSELEAETRRGLDTFGADARKATGIHWNSSQSVTLTLATDTNATTQVTYAYDSNAQSATAQCLYRVLGDASSTLPRRVLVHHVASDFAFRRYKLDRTGATDNSAATDLETKQLEIVFRSSRSGSTTVAANQAALSARYVLRNKRVTN
jgi:Tfp pilus assembly protein PilW